MMDHFGVKSRRIKAVWMARNNMDTNMDQFNRLTMPEIGLSDEEAARRTWTGRRAADHGFTTAAIQFKDGSPGVYLEVHVQFTR